MISQSASASAVGRPVVAVEMAGDLKGQLVGKLETVHDQRRDAVLPGKFQAAHAHLIVDDQKIQREAGRGGDFEEALLLILAANGAGFEAVFRQRAQRAPFRRRGRR